MNLNKKYYIVIVGISSLILILVPLILIVFNGQIAEPFGEAKIYIDDSDPRYNWNITTRENTWCSGLGTVEDPYLIEGLTLNSGNFPSCIKIKNSNAFFRITSCTFDAPRANVVTLFNVSNGEFSYNNISSAINAIELVQSKNLNCSYNTQIWHTVSRGIVMTGCHNSIIKGNYLYPSLNGIYLSGSHNNTFKIIKYTLTKKE